MTQNIFIGLSIAALSLVSLLLSLMLFKKYRIKTSYAFWGMGVFLVFVTIMQEAIIYFGYWSEFFIQTYIFLIALLVGLISIGSVLLLKSKIYRYIWIVYVTLASLVTFYYSYTLLVPQSIVVNGVIINNVVLPVMDVVASSLLTIPAACVIIILALASFIKNKSYQPLLIALGVVIITIAGTLYIVNFPVLLYYAQFIGIVVLFFGFISLPKKNISNGANK